VNKILDKMAYGPTVFLGTVFFLMPFAPEPHIIEKIMIIYNGEGMVAMSWFDIVLHGSAGLIALTKHLRHRELLGQGETAEGDRNAKPGEKSDKD